MKVRIVILNYNGERLLRECLPSILESTRRTRHEARVTVIDNRSEDRSLEVLEQEFPEAEIYVARENRVLCTYNEFLRGTNEPLVVLLNNDIRVHPEFLDPLVSRFESEGDLFMVTPRCLSFDGSHYEGGRSQSRIRFGLFWNSSRFDGYESRVDESGFTMAAGFGAFDRRKFLELDGYDDLYLPGRLEDTDLCFRAWRRGWKSFYEPRSVVYHQGAASFNERFGSRKTMILGHRNAFLFLWKNIRDPWYWAEHLFFLGPRLIYAGLAGKPELIAAFFQALPLLPFALRRRHEQKGERALLRDREMFALVN